MILYYFIASLLCILLIFAFRNNKVSAAIGGLFIICQLLLTVYFAINQNRTDATYFTYDAIGMLFSFILLFIGAASYYHGLIYLKNSSNWNYAIYQSGFIGLMTSITGVYFSDNITVTWIFMEATTLSVAALIYHNRTSQTLEATWKYVFICSVGIALAYIGILLLSTSLSGETGADMSYSSLYALANNADPVYLKLAFLFILTGFSAKLEIFPLYTIGIDANYVAPAPISAFISSALVNAGFVALFRVYVVFSNTPVFEWVKHVLLITGILSLLIAAIYMQRVKNFKRMFAYSTVENMGLVAIALGIGGIGYYAAFIQIILHSLIKSSLFLQLGQAHKVLKTYKIFKTGNYFNLHAGGAFIILIGTVAITAIPPSGLFISEFLVFKALFYNGSIFLFLLILVLLTIVLYGLVTKVYQMLFAPVSNPQVAEKVENSELISQYVLLSFAVLFCFYQPDFIMNLIDNALKGLPL